MIIQRAKLFSDMSVEAINEIKSSIVEESHDRGAILFKQDEPADYFFTLMEGRVELAIGKQGEIDYTVSQPGEIFGLSSVVDRECYTADAKCTEPTKVAKIQKDKLDQILEKYPRDATLFYKHLSSAIMKRLLDNYQSFLSQGSLQGVSYGTGQVAGDSEE
ncbi:MAG: cyclic nucleotide-binding domain-containing protein [Deltaproteobacteria bacterium]|nr:cyclic nucleotide-binding domain-containing protein [Deltaproteobacteria bacterium]